MTMVLPFTGVGSSQEATAASWRSQVGSLHIRLEHRSLVRAELMTK